MIETFFHDFLSYQANVSGWSYSYSALSANLPKSWLISQGTVQYRLISEHYCTYAEVQTYQQRWRQENITGIWLCHQLPVNTPASRIMASPRWLHPDVNLPYFYLHRQPTGLVPKLTLPATRLLEIPLEIEDFILRLLDQQLCFSPQLALQFPKGIGVNYQTMRCKSCREDFEILFTGSALPADLTPDLTIQSNNAQIPLLDKLNDLIYNSNLLEIAIQVARHLDLRLAPAQSYPKKIGGRLTSGQACPHCLRPVLRDSIDWTTSRVVPLNAGRLAQFWVDGPLSLHLPIPHWTIDNTPLLFSSLQL